MKSSSDLKIKVNTHRVSLSIHFEPIHSRNLWESFFISLCVQALSAATNQRIWKSSTTDRNASPL